jgi:hypothetical protein
LGYGATSEMEALLEQVSKLVVAYASAIESNDEPLVNSATPVLLNPLFSSSRVILTGQGDDQMSG